MIISFFKEIYLFFPYSFRTKCYSLVKPNEYRKFKKMFFDEVDEGYSFEGFFDKNCIFIHIPKAAGISINKSLFKNYGGGHRPAIHYKMLFKNKDFKNMYKFTFVRNPYDRLFSAYNYLNKGGFNKRDRDWKKKHLTNINSFEEFVMQWLSAKNIKRNLHFIPQYKFIYTPFSLKKLVDFVGYYENLDHDYHQVLKRLSINEELEKLNTNNITGSYKDHYSKEMKDKVSALYKVDLKLFKYDFDGRR